MRVHEYVSDSDPSLRYRFEADDGGTLLISVGYGDESCGTFRLPRMTALGMIRSLRDFVDGAGEDEERITAESLEPAPHLRAEARVVRSVRHELALQVCVAAGLTMDLRLGVPSAKRLLEGMLSVVPLRHDDLPPRPTATRAAVVALDQGRATSAAPVAAAVAAPADPPATADQPATATAG